MSMRFPRDHGGKPLSEDARLMSACKGAPNFILGFCTEQLMKDGTTAVPTEDVKETVLGLVAILDEGSPRAYHRDSNLCAHALWQSERDLSTGQRFMACRKELCLVVLAALIDLDRDGLPAEPAFKW